MVYKTNKAIILAGGPSTFLYPVDKFCPRPMFPFLNRPFLEWQLRSLASNGFNEIGIALSPQDADYVGACLGEGKRFGLILHYSANDIPRGPAVCLKSFQEFIGDDPFLVVNGNVYIGFVDLGEMCKFHHANQAMVTVGIYPEAFRQGHLENIETSKDGRIQNFEILDPSNYRRRYNWFDGIYLFDSNVLEAIRDDGYMDIKEQLLPELYQSGFQIFGFPVRGYHAEIHSLKEYYSTQQKILQKGLFDGGGYSQIRESVWVGKETRISPSAHLLGPLVIGDHCTIEDNAYVIGPTVIGDHGRIGEKCLVRDSILWDRTQISEKADIEYSIIGRGCAIPREKVVRKSVIMGKDKPVTYHLTETLERTGDSVPDITVSGWRAKDLVCRVRKRMIDIILAAIGLIFCIPLFLIIAVVIKLDSRGPVFYFQRRYGKGGKDFKMYKFRTMIPNAERLQKELLDKNEVDGPVFKIFDDPRMTRVGKFLRQNSLDELPQLYNVLKGEMSLVGPRPLIMEEMRLSPAWRDFRLMVKPGITGLWQINGRSQTSFHDWIKHDVFYVRNQSFFLDMKILLKTCLWVIYRVGAY